MSMSDTTKPAALDAVRDDLILDLDVREDLRQGKEPFQRIMHARLALAEGGVLRVRAIFEPRPLFAVLAKDGFGHWSERLADDDWRVWFYPTGAPATPASEAPDPGAPPPTRPTSEAPAPRAGARLPTCGTPRPEPSDIHLLDVRDLEAPEPMVQTLAALEGMPRGHTLVQINARVPHFLIPELDRRGFQHTVFEEQPGVVRVFIRHAEELPVLDVRLLPPREKHPTIFRTFDALEPGSSFVLLNDHDPVPLRYQFQGERPDAFTWQYLEEGPAIWRVEIGRPGQD
jgi:uncharacterized protein (DUF2249 family)